jgi:hypothetical protein
MFRRRSRERGGTVPGRACFLLGLSRRTRRAAMRVRVTGSCHG